MYVSSEVFPLLTIPFITSQYVVSLFKVMFCVRTKSTHPKFVVTLLEKSVETAKTEPGFPELSDIKFTTKSDGEFVFLIYTPIF